jgi:hypothetical protein
MIRRTWTAGVLAMTLMTSMMLMTFVTPAVAAEPAAKPEAEVQAAAPRYATVEIDTSDIGEEGPIIKRRTRERTDVVLRAAGVLPGRAGADDPMIHIDVDELAGADPGYQCEVWISRKGVVLGERRRVECTLCTESEIVERAEAAVSELVAQLDTLVVEEPAAEPEPEPEPTEAEPASSSPTDDGSRKRLGTLGKAGVGLLAVGVAGAGVGAVLVALQPVVDQDDPLHETNYRPPGIVTLSAGAAVLVAGVVMLVVDRRRARSRTTALRPTLGPSTAGLVWSGRF